MQGLLPTQLDRVTYICIHVAAAAGGLYTPCRSLCLINEKQYARLSLSFAVFLVNTKNSSHNNNKRNN